MSITFSQAAPDGGAQTTSITRKCTIKGTLVGDGEV